MQRTLQSHRRWLRKAAQYHYQYLRNGRGWVLSLILIFLTFLPVSAQLIPARQWAVFRQGHGLISSNVTAVLADDGALWFGTDTGVSRFDGQWYSYATRGSTGRADVINDQVPPGKVTALAHGQEEHQVWLGTDLGYVASFDGDQWTQMAAVNSPINDLVDVGNALWIATERGLLVRQEGAIGARPELSGKQVHDLFRDDENIWAATDDGLWQLSLHQGTFEQVDLSTQGDAAREPFYAVWSDGRGTIWIGAGRTILIYSVATQTAESFKPFELGTPNIRITAIDGIPGDSVWITSIGAGAVQYLLVDDYQVSSRSFGSYGEGGLDTNVVFDVAVDRDESVWFATAVGAYRHQPWAWLDPDGIVEGLIVNDLLIDHNDHLWVATGGEGVQYRVHPYAPPEIFMPGAKGLPSGFVFALEEDPTGKIWVGTANGVAQYANGTWTTPIRSTLLPSPSIRRLEADELGLWIGTAAGLARYDFGSKRTYSEPLLAGRSVNSVVYDATEMLWVAAQDGGLWLRTPAGKWMDAAAVSAGLPERAIITTLQPDLVSPGGMYGAVLGAGIFHWDGESWTVVGSVLAPTTDRVNAVMLDAERKSIWAGSEIGLSRLDELGSTTFDAQDGVQSGAIRAIARDALGGYWFGGQKGLTYYRPEHTPPWVLPGGVNSVGVRQEDTGWFVQTTRPVGISLQRGDLQTVPDKLRLFVREIRGVEGGPWQEISSLPYSRIFDAAGAFTLEFMARDQAFNYSEPVRQEFTVVPKPGTVVIPQLGEIETPIFQLLVLFGGLALFGFGYVSFEIVQHRLRISDAVKRGYNPYISGEPVRSVDMFFGRRDMLQRIVSTLHNNSIMLHGERRIGKTTVLYQLANALRQVRDPEYWFVPTYIDLEGTTEKQLFHLLMEEIAHSVETLPEFTKEQFDVLTSLLYRSVPFDHYTDREFARDLRSVIHVLEETALAAHEGRKVRLILLVDEMDTLGQFEHLYQQQLRRIFMRDFSATLGAVVAGIEINKTWDRVESPWYNLFNEIAIPPFTREQATELLIEPVRSYYIYEADALEFILDACDGRPYRVQQYALEAVNHMLKMRRRHVKMCDVLVAHELIQSTNGHVGTDRQAAPYKPAHALNELDSLDLSSQTRPG